MKPLKSIQLSKLNLTIYLFIIVLVVLCFLFLWGTVSKTIIHPGNLTVIKLDRPIIRMQNDVYLNLRDDVLKNDPSLFQKVQRNKLIFETIKFIIFAALIILVLLQLKSLISSIQAESFFKSGNIKCVRRISSLLVIWVWMDLIIYLCIPFFIPVFVIRDSYNFWLIKGDLGNIGIGIITLLGSINYGVLLSAFAFYIISVVFNEGNRLKEEVDLTI